MKRSDYMRITELLKTEGIELGVSVDSKEDAIDRLTGLMDKTGLSLIHI